MDLTLTQIDADLHLDDHPFLESTDTCYFLREYTSRAGFKYGDTNNLIDNFHKSPLYRNRPDVWRHKIRAIDQFARELYKAISPDWIRNVVLIPIPPSKIPVDPDYDDRMVKLLEKINLYFSGICDIRELVQSRSNMQSAHSCAEGQRPKPLDLYKNYFINESLSNPSPSRICIIDDVLTAGSHFKAMQRILSERFLGVPIVGIFIARRIFQTT